MNPATYWPLYLVGATLTLVRISAILVASPVFSSRSIPVQIKAGLALVLTLAFVPPGSPPVSGATTELLPFVAMVILEVVIGLVIGFATSLVFYGIQTAAQLVGVQSGMNAANLLDPMMDSQGGLLDTFYSLFATMVFLTINGHHWLIQGMQRTFSLVPLGGQIALDTIGPRLLTMTIEVWVVALEIALPVAGALILTDVALGLLAKSVPQLNIFSVGMPAKFLVGVVLLLVTLPALAGYLDGTFRTMTAQAQNLFAG